MTDGPEMEAETAISSHTMTQLNVIRRLRPALYVRFPHFLPAPDI